MTQLSTNPVGFEDHGIMMCAKSSTSKFDNNVEGFYANSDVKVLDGSKAKKTLDDGKNFSPSLVVAYHPQCPHCSTMVTDYKELAKEAKKQGVKVDIVSVNMSKTEGFEVDGYPTIRFYKSAGKFDEFDGNHRDLAGLKKFLKKEGVAIK